MLTACTHTHDEKHPTTGSSLVFPGICGYILGTRHADELTIRALVSSRNRLRQLGGACFSRLRICQRTEQTKATNFTLRLRCARSGEFSRTAVSCSPLGQECQRLHGGNLPKYAEATAKGLSTEPIPWTPLILCIARWALLSVVVAAFSLIPFFF